MNSPPSHCSLLGRAVRLSKRVLKWMLLGLVTYVVVLLVGLIPVNNGFRPTSDGIQIFLVSNAVHADIFMFRLSTLRTFKIPWCWRFRPSNMAS